MFLFVPHECILFPWAGGDRSDTPVATGLDASSFGGDGSRLAGWPLLALSSVLFSSCRPSKVLFNGERGGAEANFPNSCKVPKHKSSMRGAAQHLQCCSPGFPQVFHQRLIMSQAFPPMRDVGANPHIGNGQTAQFPSLARSVTWPRSNWMISSVC